MADGSAHTARSKSKLVGAGVGLVCAVCLFALMAHEGQLHHAGLFGLPLMLGVVWGAWAAMGLLSSAEGAVPFTKTAYFALPGESTWRAPARTLPVALAVLAVIWILLGGHGLPLAIAAALCVLLVPAVRRPGLLVFVIGALLYLPMLGAYGLWDPWETHYGEVSREILSRDDWISLWWAQDRWFWSKPILIFWSEALTWTTTNISFHPDAHPHHTAWILRTPIFLMSIAGLMAMYAAIARLWNKRAAVVCAIVLATTPYYAFLTHQAITDMPFVANMTAAMMLLVLAMTEDPERPAKSVRFGRVALSMQHAMIGLLLCIGLPQVLYLASRNITLVHGLFAWHRDVFMSGSGGNPDVPGNVGIATERPHVHTLLMEPLAQALYWALGLFAIIWQLRRQNRAQSLYMFAFYVFCALAFMAKGIPGFALPGLVAFLALCATGRFSLLRDGRLRVATGMLIVIVLGMPWFVAMYVRHGSAFTDRILIHDHINRLTSGVHGDKGTIQYFIQQLGYGLFPWIGWTPAALGSWFISHDRDPAPTRRARRDVLVTMGLWFAASFTLFSAMTTKFHHYIFPAVPPTAVLVGLLIDRMLPAGTFQLERRGLLRTCAALLSVVPLVLGIGGLHGDLRGVIPKDVAAADRADWVLKHPWPLPACLALIALGLIGLVLAARGAPKPEPAGHSNNPLAYAAAAVSGAVLLGFVGRDMSWNVAGQPPGSERLIHLFVYNYTRPWPDYLDYRAMFFGFAAVAVALMLATAVRALRGTALTASIGLALFFTLFSLDVYMIDLTPHWTQQGLVDRYYAERTGPQQPLLAYQMNWKGENFYTGNRVYVFVELDNKPLMKWVEKNTGKTVFIVLEHTRLARLRQLLAPRKLEELTTMRDCNKFVLVRTTL